MSEICQIYVISNNVNEKVYVGQTWRSLKTRFSRHCNTSGCIKIHTAIQKHGAENFTITPVFSVRDQEAADEYEIHFINKFDSIANGYNLKLGGEGGKHSPETVEKIRKNSTGRKMSEETKKKMSESHKGQVRSEEYCKNISLAKMGEKNPMYGKKLSEEQKSRISEFHKGKKHVAKLTPDQVREIRRLLATGELSQQKIGDLFGVARSTILHMHLGINWKDVI